MKLYNCFQLNTISHTFPTEIFKLMTTKRTILLIEQVLGECSCFFSASHFGQVERVLSNASFMRAKQLEIQCYITIYSLDTEIHRR